MSVRALTVTLLLSAAVPVAAAGPRMKIVTDSRDLGVVTQGEVVSVSFEIANTGDSPLEIQVQPTCGCTIADFDRSIDPGATGLVKADLDTAGFRGQIRKTLLVTSNDPVSPSASLEVAADVRPVLEVSPKPLVRIETDQGRSASSSVSIKAADPAGGAFSVTSVEPSQPWVRATVTAVSGDGPSRYDIQLEVTADAPAGILNVPVVVHTDHPKAPTLDLRVVGRVRGSA